MLLISGTMQYPSREVHLEATDGFDLNKLISATADESIDVSLSASC